MYPKLKPDAYWVPHSDGVMFLHSRGYLSVNGSSTMPLMNRLAPYLDGSHSLETLTNGLDDGRRSMVITLVSALAEAGLVKDVTGDLPHGLTDAELDMYSAEIAYVDYYLDSAAMRFQRYRETPVLCLGSGLTLAALVHSCLATGVRDVSVAVTGDCDTDLDRIAEHQADAIRRDPNLRPRILAADPADPAELLRLSGASVVLHVCDVPVLDRARQLDRLRRSRDITVMQGVVVGDEAWTGPLAGPEHGTSGGWESAWARRAATRIGDAAAADACGSEFLAGPTASIVAHRLSFAVFRTITGVADVDRPPGSLDGDSRDLLTRMNLETLQTTGHRAYPHPLTAPANPPGEAEFDARMATFRAAVALPGPEFSQRSASAFDPEVGLLCELDEDEQRQLPLCVSLVRLSDPFRLLDTAAGLPVVAGCGDDMLAARYDAALAALIGYAGVAVDRRRLPDGMALVHDLVGDRPAWVAATLAYPVLTYTGPASAWRRPVGLCAGTDGARSLQIGLAEQVAARTVAEVAAGVAEVCTLDDAAFAAAGERAGRYRELLRIAGADVDLHRVVGRLGLPVYLGRHRNAVIGCSPDLTEVLIALLLAEQGIPVATVDLPALPPTGPVAPPQPPEPLPPWTELVERLDRAGYRPYAVPGCHDPVLDTLLPTLVGVVLGD